MPLIQSDLADALAAIYASLPPVEESAERMAEAYGDYVQTAVFGGAVPVVTGLHKDAMKATLLAAIDPPIIGLPATMAAAWAAALTVFWAAMPVAGLGVAGVSEGCPGASDAIGPITGVYANLANTPESCGAGVAAALQTATETVTAMVSGVSEPLA